MKKKFLSAVLILIFLILTACNSQSQQNSHIHSTVKSLTSKSYQGRLTGTTGNEKAAAYIESMYKKIGLASYEKNTYKIPYTQEIYNPDKQIHTMKIYFPDNSVKDCAYGQDFLEQGVIENLQVDSPITFDINDSAMQNKIFVTDNSKDIGKVIGSAKCILIKKDIFKKYIVKANGTPIIQISPEVFELIKNKKTTRLSINNSSPAEQATVYNIVGKIKGNNSKSVLVISAHFDHVGWSGDKIYRGAADNASSVAVLIDLAQKLKNVSNEKTYDKDILFCAFNGEESHLAGSKAFVDTVKKDYENVYNINIDYVGAKSGGKLIVAGDPHISAQLVNVLNTYLNEKGFDAEIGEKGYTSDHISFSDKGIVSLNIGQKDTQKMHTASDTVGEIDFDYLIKLSDTLFRFILENNGKTYNHVCTDICNSNKNNEFAGADTSITDKVAEETKTIKVDEYKVIEIKGRRHIVKHDLGEFNTLQDLAAIYPTFKLVSKIDNFELRNVSVINNTTTNIYPEKVSLDKVYKRDMYLKDVSCLDMVYSVKRENRLFINILKVDETPAEDPLLDYQVAYMEDLNERGYLDEKTTSIGNIPYNLIYNKNSKKPEGLYAKVVINQHIYNIQIRHFENTGYNENIVDFVRKADISSYIDSIIEQLEQ